VPGREGANSLGGDAASGCSIPHDARTSNDPCSNVSPVGRPEGTLAPASGCRWRRRGPRADGGGRGYVTTALLLVSSGCCQSILWRHVDPVSPEENPIGTERVSPWMTASRPREPSGAYTRAPRPTGRAPRTLRPSVRRSTAAASVAEQELREVVFSSRFECVEGRTVASPRAHVRKSDNVAADVRPLRGGEIDR